jgi:energy-coupling factor transport system permease protein
MSNRLGFYIERDSAIHRLNPLTKLVLVLVLIGIDYLGPFIWLPSLIFGLIIFPLSIAGRVWREFLGITVKLFLPAAGFMFIMQAIFLPVGTTTIFSFWIFDVTLESLQTAYLNASRLLTLVTAFLLLLLTTHPGALMSDLARRGVPGAISYIITSTLQILPQMQAKASTIMDAQRSRGLETQGSLRKRIRALVPLVGPLVFGSLVDVQERAIAIEARAFNSGRSKTSLVEIGDPPWERVLRWGLVLLLLLVVGSRLWLL